MMLRVPHLARLTGCITSHCSIHSLQTTAALQLGGTTGMESSLTVSLQMM